LVRHRLPPESTEDHKNKKGFATLRPYLILLRGQERDLGIGTLLMVVSTLASLLIPIQAGNFVDRMGTDATLGLSVRGLGLLFGLLVLQLTASFFFSVISARLGLRTTARLRRRLFAHLLELPSLFFTRQKAGDLSTRVSSDVDTIQSILTSGLVNLARALGYLRTRGRL
jgi:ABC-type multidrug transport system fused ATPase/permease subunit